MMGQGADDGVVYLVSQSGESLFHLFWFVIIFEFPRYILAFFSVAVCSFLPMKPRNEARASRVTVVIAGHNEEKSIERCVLCLREQTRPPDEIIVISDGSTDGMPQKLPELRDRGLIQEAHCTQLRAGKSAATNLGFGRATGNIVINVDCDCTFDRHAIEEMVRPFADAQVGAVVGNIVVRRPHANLVSGFQAIEYLITISQGKLAENLTDHVTCISGAFGAFRRIAIERVGGLDSGGGEDLDLTLRLRASGWKMVFAPNATCYTDPPATLGALARQRFRWERDALRLRCRKHRNLLNPFSPRFRFTELLHLIDFVGFNVVAAFAFPFYLVWLFVTYRDLAPVILLGAQTGMLALDAVTFLLAAWLTPKVNSMALMPYLLGYSTVYGLMMRIIRITAYTQEWIFNASYRDSYVPMKVHRVRR